MNKIIVLDRKSNQTHYRVDTQYTGGSNWKPIHRLCELYNEPLIADFLSPSLISVSDSYKTFTKTFVRYGESSNTFVDFWLPNIDFLLLSNCTLKCNYCNYGCSKTSHHWRYSPSQVIKYLDIFSALGLRFDTLSILGGEPLIHGDLVKILLIITSNYSHLYKNIQIDTNGTRMLDNEDLLIISKIPNLNIVISSYGEYSSQGELLFNECKKHGIEVRCNYEAKSEVYRSDPMKFLKIEPPKRTMNFNEEEVKEVQHHCSFGYTCNSFVCGSLYRCPLASVYGFNAESNYQLTGDEWINFDDIDIKNEASLQEARIKIIKNNILVRERKHLELCHYCFDWRHQHDDAYRINADVQQLE